MVSDFDVAVVGSGPAGTAAAVSAVRKGLRTILLESELFPRDRPGESLHPGVEVLYEQLGVRAAILEAKFPRYPGQVVGWGASLHFQAFGNHSGDPWLGFHAWRSRLDAILLQHAMNLGVAVKQGCQAGDPILDSGRIVGFHTPIGDIFSRFVIDASGGRHWLQRKMKLNLTRMTRQLIAAYGYSRVTDRKVASVPLLLGQPDGWVWTAQVKPDVLAWTRLQFEEFQKSPPQWLSEFEALGPIRGADVTWRIVQHCAGAGYFIVGDAACVVDPASSHGVLKAIMSGMLASHLISHIEIGAMSELNAILTFSDWMARWFDNDTRKLEHLYGVFGFRPAVRRRQGSWQ